MIEDDDFYKTSKLDIVIVALILCVSIFFILPFFYKQTQRVSQPGIALIYQKNKLVEEVGLDKNKTIALLGGQMRIEVRDGKIRVLSSNCPQHICVNMGWIKYSGQTIVCAPNHILIEIKPQGSSILDAVSY